MLSSERGRSFVAAFIAVVLLGGVVAALTTGGDEGAVAVASDSADATPEDATEGDAGDPDATTADDADGAGADEDDAEEDGTEGAESSGDTAGSQDPDGDDATSTTRASTADGEAPSDSAPPTTAPVTSPPPTSPPATSPPRTSPAPRPQAPSPPPPSTPPAPASSSSAAESECESLMVRWVNEARSATGRRPLTTRSDLTTIARDWSTHMASRGALSHQDQMQVLRRVGASTTRENVGQSTLSARHVFDTFMNSNTHRANILAGNVTHIGVGCVFSGSTWWVTQTFVG